MRDASKLWPCWPMAHRVIRERDRGWPGLGPPWTWLCSDIARGRSRGESVVSGRAARRAEVAEELALIAKTRARRAEVPPEELVAEPGPVLAAAAEAIGHGGRLDMSDPDMPQVLCDCGYVTPPMLSVGAARNVWRSHVKFRMRAAAAAS